MRWKTVDRLTTDAMAQYFLIFITALLMVTGTMPLIKRAAVRWGFIDRPSERKIHHFPVPRIGGVAIYAGCITALLLFERGYVSQMASILVGASLVSFLGLWDDRRPLSPLLKLTGQLLAAAIPVASGIQVHFLHQTVLDLIVTFLWIVGITNAMNLLDNMDGLSGGVATVASVFFFLLAVMNGQYLVASLSVALLGACIGFLFYNFNPASVFMGDTGSLFIGFMLAMVGIKLRFPGNDDLVTWMIPVVILGLPIFDTTLVVVSRLGRRLNPFTTPGKDHVSHRLVARGMNWREAVVILYLVCFSLGVIGVLLMHVRVVEGYMVGSAVLGLGLYALWRLGKVQV